MLIVKHAKAPNKSRLIRNGFAALQQAETLILGKFKQIDFFEKITVHKSAGWLYNKKTLTGWDM